MMRAVEALAMDRARVGQLSRASRYSARTDPAQGSLWLQQGIERLRRARVPANSASRVRKPRGSAPADVRRLLGEIYLALSNGALSGTAAGRRIDAQRIQEASCHDRRRPSEQVLPFLTLIPCSSLNPILNGDAECIVGRLL
jgi:hypothetical protein